MEDNPYKTLESKVVYKNPWISVREDKILRPDESEGIYGVVETRIATGVVALTPENEIYLVGQYRYTLQEYSWEIIEGGVDDNEEPLAAIKRELKEEAGIEAEHWEPLGHELALSNCVTSEIGYLYLARGLTVGEPSPDVTEVLAVKKIPLKEAYQMVQRGEIKDTMSIIGILQASLQVNSEFQWSE